MTRNGLNTWVHFRDSYEPGSILYACFVSDAPVESLAWPAAPWLQNYHIDTFGPSPNSIIPMKIDTTAAMDFGIKTTAVIDNKGTFMLLDLGMGMKKLTLALGF